MGGGGPLVTPLFPELDVVPPPPSFDSLPLFLKSVELIEYFPSSNRWGSVSVGRLVLIPGEVGGFLENGNGGGMKGWYPLLSSPTAMK